LLNERGSVDSWALCARSLTPLVRAAAHIAGYVLALPLAAVVVCALVAAPLRKLRVVVFKELVHVGATRCASWR